MPSQNSNHKSKYWRDYVILLSFILETTLNLPVFLFGMQTTKLINKTLE